jgi:3D (Asp-Asp-Asp) domain-containing protein
VAADPAVLPLGSLIRVSGLAGGFNGVYTVADKGSKVRGNTIDIYMSDCWQAVRFGRQRARVAVVQRSS